jgi:hypothetical protein
MSSRNTVLDITFEVAIGLLLENVDHSPAELAGLGLDANPRASAARRLLIVTTTHLLFTD